MAVKQKIVFVTGGTGRIGHHLVTRLAEQGFYVRVLTRKQNNPWTKVANIETIRGDILDKNIIRKTIEGCDYLFHLAVYQNIEDKNKDLFSQVNVEGTKTVLNSAVKSGVKKVVYVSTAAVFESTRKSEADENWAQKSSCPNDHYVQTKIEALAFVRQMKKFLPIVVVYPTAVIDLNSFSSAAPALSGRWQKFLWERVGGGIPGGLINLIGSKDRIFNYLAVEDLAESLIRAATMGKAGEEYILGGENITVGNYLRLASQRLKRKVFPVRVPFFIFRVLSQLKRFIALPPIVNLISQAPPGNMCFSSEKARKFLGHSPKLKL